MSLVKLQKKLDDLIQLMQENVTKGDEVALVGNNKKYLAVLQELMSLYPGSITKDELTDNLKHCLDRQHTLIAALEEQKKELQKSLNGTHKIRHYLTS